VRHRVALVVLGVVVLVVSIVPTVFGWTGWPWEPLRFWLACVAVVALLTGSPRAALLALVAWAAVACPLTVRSAAGGGARIADAELLARGVPSGPHRVELGPLPLGPLWFTTPDKSYVNGESDDDDRDIVAWSVTWLPWPHIERDTVVGVFDEDVDSTLVGRDDHRILVRAGHETRRVVFGFSTSKLTWVGWIAILVALRRRRRKPQQA